MSFVKHFSLDLRVRKINKLKKISILNAFNLNKIIFLEKFISIFLGFKKQVYLQIKLVEQKLINY